MNLTSAHIPNIFKFATEQARTIVGLDYIDLAIVFVIMFSVAGLLGAALIKFRARPGDKEPVQNTGNIKLEITWTVIPVLILLFLGVKTAEVMRQVNVPIKNQKPDVVVVAHQWWWEYRYPKYGVVTANELYLPEGYNSLLEIRSADVDHSFWVPSFGEKMDAIPGHPNYLFMKPIRKGLFLGSCSEFCGAQHSLMRILVEVVSREDFQNWLEAQLKVPPEPADEPARHGKALFLKKTCQQCHSIAGTSARGNEGPNLTHLAARKTLGSGVLANNTDNLTQWIMNPQRFKPGIYMPKMRISRQDAHDIALYLEGIK